MDQNKAKRAAISVASELGRGALAGSIGNKIVEGVCFKVEEGIIFLSMEDSLELRGGIVLCGGVIF